MKPLILCCTVALLCGQAQKNGGFDVASVKPSGNLDAPGRVQILPGGTLRIINCDLPFIIQQVYGLAEYQVIRGPAVPSNWGNSSFDLDAKSDHPTGDAEVRLMTQRLLAERFQLKVHREKRTFAVYLLTVDKKGSKIQSAAAGGRGSIELVEKDMIRGHKATMDRLVSVLTRSLGQPVLDRTGIQEPFDFTLAWSDGGDGAAPSEANRASLFTAIREQLGLVLTPEKTPIDVLVVDSVNTTPSAN